MCSSAFWNTVVQFVFLQHKPHSLCASESAFADHYVYIVFTYLFNRSQYGANGATARPPGLPRTISANHANLIKFLEE